MNEDESRDEVNEQREEGRKEGRKQINIQMQMNLSTDKGIMCSNSAHVLPTFSSTLQKVVGCTLLDVVK